MPSGVFQTPAPRSFASVARGAVKGMAEKFGIEFMAPSKHFNGNPKHELTTRLDFAPLRPDPGGRRRRTAAPTVGARAMSERSPNRPAASAAALWRPLAPFIAGEAKLGAWAAKR